LWDCLGWPAGRQITPVSQVTSVSPRSVTALPKVRFNTRGLHTNMASNILNQTDHITAFKENGRSLNAFLESKWKATYDGSEAVL
jgi:hypothetical protein